MQNKIYNFHFNGMDIFLRKKFIFHIIIVIAAIILFGCASKKYNSNDGENIFSNSLTLFPDKRLVAMPIEPLPVIENMCMNTTDFDYQNAGISMNSYPHIEVSDYKKYFSRSGKFDFYLHPIICDGMVYDIRNNSKIVAYTVNNERVKKIWQKNLLTNKEQGNILISNARLEDDILYIATGNGFVIAFNTKNMEILWKRKFSTMFAASPTIYEDNLYLISSDDDVYAINKNTGELFWKIAEGVHTNKKSFQIPPVAIFKGKIVAGLSNGFILVIDNNGKLIWKNKILSAKNTEDDLHDIDFPPILFNNILVAGGIRNGIVGFDFDSGQPLWQIPTGLNSYMFFNQQGIGFFVSSEDEKISFIIKNGLIRSVTSFANNKTKAISGYLNDGNNYKLFTINRYYDSY